MDLLGVGIAVAVGLLLPLADNESEVESVSDVVAVSGRVGVLLSVRVKLADGVGSVCEALGVCVGTALAVRVCDPLALRLPSLTLRDVDWLVVLVAGGVCVAESLMLWLPVIDAVSETLRDAVAGRDFVAELVAAETDALGLAADLDSVRLAVAG